MLRLPLRVALLMIGTVVAAQATTIPEQRASLRRMKNSIDATKRQIAALERDERTTTRSISGYEKRRQNVAQTLAALQLALTNLQDSASTVSKSIEQTTSELERARSDYDDLARAMIRVETERHGLHDDRYKIPFRESSRQLSSYTQRSLRYRDSLMQQQQFLQDISASQEHAIVSQAAQDRNLQQLIKNQKSNLDQLRSSKASLAQELSKRKQSAQQVSSLIATLERQAKDEADRKAKAAAAKRNNTQSARTGATPAASSPLTTGKGFGTRSLPWPTSSRALLHGFGTYSNKSTGTQFDNPGIDIKAPTGSVVRAVAGGTISSVTWLPGYGSLVIVDHNNGFRSVYANLQSASVSRGTRISAGGSIGTSGENIDGELVHFEIWQGRQKMNPTTFLR